MAPPCHSFPASQLPREVQLDVRGRKRKLSGGGKGGGTVDLSSCALMSMVQYNCAVDYPEQPNSPVRCWPIQRLFRR